MKPSNVLATTESLTWCQPSVGALVLDLTLPLELHVPLSSAKDQPSEPDQPKVGTVRAGPP